VVRRESVESRLKELDEITQEQIKVLGLPPPPRAAGNRYNPIA